MMCLFSDKMLVSRYQLLTLSLVLSSKLTTVVNIPKRTLISFPTDVSNTAEVRCPSSFLIH